jgi:hypothetical protein
LADVTDLGAAHLHRSDTSDRPVAILTGTGLKDLRRFTPTRHDAPVHLDDLRSLLERTFSLPRPD